MSNPIAPTFDDLVEARRLGAAAAGGHQQAEAVLAAGQGSVVLCTATIAGGREQTWLLALGRDGALQWNRRYGPEHGAGRALAALPDGGYAIAGDIQRSELEYEAHLARIDGRGELLAERAFGPRGATGFVAAASLGNGSTVAGGTAGWHGWLLCAGDDLLPRWELPLGDIDDVYGLAALGNGAFAVAAAAEKSTTSLGTTRVLACNAGGSVRWQATLPRSGRAEPAALAALRDGGVVVAGHASDDEGGAARLWIARLDGRGQILWERRLGAAGEERRGRALALLGDEHIVVAGDALLGGRRTLRVARLTTAGDVVWERAYGEGDQSIARGLARTGGDDLVLAGSTTAGAEKTNVLVLSLAGDGRKLWQRTFP
jgi:outer membrane protein assembly factor BamB